MIEMRQFLELLVIDMGDCVTYALLKLSTILGLILNSNYYSRISGVAFISIIFITISKLILFVSKDKKTQRGYSYYKNKYIAVFTTILLLVSKKLMTPILSRYNPYSIFCDNCISIKNTLINILNNSSFRPALTIVLFLTLLLMFFIIVINIIINLIRMSIFFTLLSCAPLLVFYIMFSSNMIWGRYMILLINLLSRHILHSVLVFFPLRYVLGISNATYYGFTSACILYSVYLYGVLKLVKSYNGGIFKSNIFNEFKHISKKLLYGGLNA